MTSDSAPETSGLLGAGAVRGLATELGLRPTKQWGQNFVVDANTVRRIVRLAGVGADDVVVEVGPGLGSLTLALLPEVSRVFAVEVDPVLAGRLAQTVAEFAPRHIDALEVIHQDALTVDTLPVEPTALVANLPYNVSVPVILRFLERFASIRRVLVMVQLEVAERLCAAPGSKTYGVPSVKAAWYGRARLVGTVGRSVFWPAPNVDSGLVEIVRGDPPTAEVAREQVFRVVDAAFAQRRKTLRAALSGIAGGAPAAEAALVAADIDPRTRGEQLDVTAFTRLAAALTGIQDPDLHE
ncbi:16S rRNA (adenine(1518)-N(6)/adenine(1519)-N(6))-dimethyltransferase RsmA [Mobilicoccus caccae]|uniref:Ribosomal RNA small subunit methyltransferase A n=1 Tax=Mobilicoccus caccae TaxID=1859295 RepID=A0ABQ6IVK4_9MICO|nr:16S rRNA (adenine(1518)-N(6)/adenine(1519)-N(6))-dimethyltransferase RsmA [Mobilicoccus caccae]GMA40762.1 ribosomal RNA small subunit methyltransferase A [Mobilicoccus caccae]